MKKVKAIVAPIAVACNVCRIYHFCFYACGESTSSSDADLRVDKGRLKGVFPLGALYADSEDGIGKKTDILATGSLEQKFPQYISDEEVLRYAS